MSQGSYVIMKSGIMFKTYSQNIPLQKNYVDCGIFCCQVSIATTVGDCNLQNLFMQYAKHVAFNQELCFTQVSICTMAIFSYVVTHNL